MRFSVPVGSNMEPKRLHIGSTITHGLLCRKREKDTDLNELQNQASSSKHGGSIVTQRTSELRFVFYVAPKWLHIGAILEPHSIYKTNYVMFVCDVKSDGWGMRLLAARRELRHASGACELQPKSFALSIKAGF
jgi:hypothetical protein